MTNTDHDKDMMLLMNKTGLDLGLLYPLAETRENWLTMLAS
jgi:hypothetical protein